tara:strand:- start:422 stop:736 length:315 start_codon:yes stop_codon:yes gene_type:complete
MIEKAVFELYPDARSVEHLENNNYIVRDADYNELTVDDTAVQARASELQAVEDAKQYQRDRAEAYPSLKEQMDMQYWDSVNGTTNWKDKIAEIKALYPKPTENN